MSLINTQPIAQEIKDIGTGVKDFADNVVNKSSESINLAVKETGHTLRDVKDETLVLVDNQGDQLTEVLAKFGTGVLDTIQIGMLIGGGISLVFLILNSDKLFQNGFRVGKLNFF